MKPTFSTTILVLLAVVFGVMALIRLNDDSLIVIFNIYWAAAILSLKSKES